MGLQKIGHDWPTNTSLQILRGIFGSNRNSMLNINTLRKCHSISQGSCIIFSSHKQCMRFPVSLDLCQCLLFLIFFFIITILVGVKWYLTVLLTYTFLMIYDTEYLFVCLIAICVFSLNKYIFNIFKYYFVF